MSRKCISTDRRQAEEERDGLFSMSLNRLGMIGCNHCGQGVGPAGTQSPG